MTPDPTLGKELAAVVQAFVVRVASLAAASALNTLQTCLATRESGSSPAIVRRRHATSRRRLVKRPTHELDALTNRLLEFIETNPGLRVEQVNRQQGTRTRELALPLRNLGAGWEGARARSRACDTLHGFCAA